jgi:hypothetical protein
MMKRNNDMQHVRTLFFHNLSENMSAHKSRPVIVQEILKSL